VDGANDSINGNWTYSYDEFSRLSTAAQSGDPASHSYQYDQYGNLQQQTYGSSTISTLTNPATNQVTGETYDVAGNMLTDGINRYTYDGEGRMVGMTGSATASYVYDALGQRVQAVVNGVTTDYAYNPNGQRDQVWDMGHQMPHATQVYSAGGSPLAYFDTKMHYQHQDWQGTERMRMLADGSVEAKFQSLPFGSNFTAQGSDSDPYHFAMLDADPGMNQHAANRELSSLQGRWNSPDPYAGSYDFSNPQSFNRYAYVLNMPMTYDDPSGLALPDCGNEQYYDLSWIQEIGQFFKCGGGGGGDGGDYGFDGGIGSYSPGASGYGPISGGGGGGTAPNNAPLSPQAQACENKIQGAVNSALNTNSNYLGPTTGPGLSPMGYRNGAYNFNFFAPGVTNPVAESNGGSGRFPGSGLHIPLPGGQDPTIMPWGYNAQAGGSYFTAHYDSANPTDDLVSFFEHIINDVILRRPHGC
jgi:RHS repeat-associated protein